MTTTIHGWPVIYDMGDPRLRLFDVPGTDRRLRLREDVGPYLVAFAAEYHRIIAPIDKGTFDDWAWSPYRKGRASTRVSDHCAGIAIDLNATGEGSQAAHTLTWWANPVRRAKLARLRRRFTLLEWGGDYKSFRDPMHWVLAYGVTVADVRRHMRRMKIRPDGTIAG